MAKKRLSRSGFGPVRKQTLSAGPHSAPPERTSSEYGRARVKLARVRSATCAPLGRARRANDKHHDDCFNRPYNADRAVTDHPEAGTADEFACKQSGSCADEQNYDGAFV